MVDQTFFSLALETIANLTFLTGAKQRHHHEICLQKKVAFDDRGQPWFPSINHPVYPPAPPYLFCSLSKQQSWCVLCILDLHILSCLKQWWWWDYITARVRFLTRLTLPCLCVSLCSCPVSLKEGISQIAVCGPPHLDWAPIRQPALHLLEPNQTNQILQTKTNQSPCNFRMC